MDSKTLLVGTVSLTALVVIALPRLRGDHRAESVPTPSSSAPTRTAPAPAAVASAPATTPVATTPVATAPVATTTVATTPTPAVHGAPAAPSASERKPIEVQPIRVGDEPIQPIPSVDEFFEDYLEIDRIPEKIELGRRLFHDTRLSRDNSISCASCHDLRFGGVDRAPSAVGVAGQVGPINTPTVFNAALNVQQFWDGRAPDLEAQADGPPNAAGEMASNWAEINSKLVRDEEIVDLLRRAYRIEGELPADLGKDYWLEAISDYERTLLTPGAPFDRYLLGDADAVSEEAKEGYQLFKDVGCIECHNGMGVGGSSFQKLGRKNPYFGAHLQGPDLGRFNVTSKDEDRGVFKVPGLRNVALTGPWFHDASQGTLEEATRTMARVQLDRTLDDHEVSRIVAFLRSLTGTFEGLSVDLFSPQR